MRKGTPLASRVAQGVSGPSSSCVWNPRVSHTPAACSCPGEHARSWGALGEARPGQSSLSAGALRYRAWAQSWSSAALAARSVLPSNRPATPLFSPACWEPSHRAWWITGDPTQLPKGNSLTCTPLRDRLSGLKLTSIESVMPFSHLILCRPLLLLPLIPPSIRVFSSGGGARPGSRVTGGD